MSWTSVGAAVCLERFVSVGREGEGPHSAVLLLIQRAGTLPDKDLSLIWTEED